MIEFNQEQEIIKDPAQLDLYDLIFEWKPTGRVKEYICSCSPYRLTIEKVEKKCWWWLLEKDNEAIDGVWFRDDIMEWPHSKSNAKAVSEAAYLKFVKQHGEAH